MFNDQIHVRAKVRVHQERAYDYDEKRGLWLYKQVGEDVESHNILTNTGRVQLHNFCYGQTPRTNGFNYIGVSNDATPPAASDTSLAGELTADGLARAPGSVALPVGSGNITTISIVFLYTGVPSQGVQKTAIFDSAIAGVMNHEILFTPKTLVTNDTLTLIFSITLG